MSYYSEAIAKHIFTNGVNEGKEEYQAFFKSALEKFNTKSPADLDDSEKKEFFNYIDKNYKAKNESTKDYTKTLEKMAKDNTLGNISKKDKETLAKIAAMMKSANESASVSEGKLSSKVRKAILIAIGMSGNMTDAVKKIEKMSAGLSDDPKVAAALKLANESKWLGDENNQSVDETLIEAKKIDGSYLMKMLKDMAKDAKRDEPKLAKALMYLHSRINQSHRDDDLNADDLNDLLKDPRGRKHARDLPDWMIDSFFEGVERNEAKNTRDEWSNFEKAFGDFFTTVLKLGKANTKLTGDKTDEKIMIKNYNKDVGKFYSLMKSWQRGQNESVEEKKTKDKRTNKAYNPDKMFDKAITSKWFKRIAKKLKEGKLSEDYKNSEWEVFVADKAHGKAKIVKKVKSKRAAVILYNKLIDSDKYEEVGMRVVKESVNEGKFGKFDTGAAFKGNGMTIYDRNQSQGGDFKNIAHIGNDGKITIWDKNIKKEAKLMQSLKKISQEFKTSFKESVNEAGDAFEKLKPSKKALITTMKLLNKVE